MSHPAVHGHYPGFFQGVTATPAGMLLAGIALAVALVVLLVIGRLARAVAHLAKAAKPAPAAPAKKSGHGGLWLLALAAGGGLWFYETHHKTAAAPVRAAPAPHPTPQPTVTRTVAPHTPAGPSPFAGLLNNLTAFLNHLTGTDWVLIVLIGAVFTFAAVRPLLRRSS